MYGGCLLCPLYPLLMLHNRYRVFYFVLGKCWLHFLSLASDNWWLFLFQMGLLTLLCLTDLLLSVICSVQHAPLTYKYYGGLFTLLHYLISAMVTLYCLYSCLYFNLVMFLVFLERQKTVYRSVRKTRTISSTVIYCCSGWQKAYSSSRECREGTFQRLLLQ